MVLSEISCNVTSGGMKVSGRMTSSKVIMITPRFMSRVKFNRFGATLSRT